MIEAITGFIAAQGYWAIALLMCAENLFPPLPSELIMPFAGFVAARGDLHPLVVVLAGTFGSIVGCLPWFVAARTLGAQRLGQLADRHGRWFTVSSRDLDRAARWFRRHGAPVLVLGRLLPGVRTLIAIPAGFAGISWPRFIAWSALGSSIWCALLVAAGYLMESRYEQIGAILEPASRIVLGAVVVLYFIRVARAGRA